jgi:hypothetical protein
MRFDAATAIYGWAYGGNLFRGRLQNNDQIFREFTDFLSRSLQGLATKPDWRRPLIPARGPQAANANIRILCKNSALIAG